MSGLLVGTSLGLGYRPLAAAGRPLRWGSATLGSTGYVIIEALASTVNRLTPLKGASVATGGASENMALLGQKEIDLGQTTSWEWQPARKGEAPFKQKIEPVQMLSYAVWTLHPLVRADSGIKRLEDLAGKRVSPGPYGGVTPHLWKVLFEKAGLYDKVRWTYASWRETYDAFKAGAVDCIGSIMIDGRPSPIMRETETTHKFRPLPLDLALIREVQKVNPGTLIIPVGPDKWQSLTAPIDTVGASGILAAAREISDDDGYTIVKTIYDNADDIRTIAVDLNMIRIENATRYLLPGFPVNAGAARYYREKGVWREDLTARA
jgi:hypothetical protein